MLFQTMDSCLSKYAGNFQIKQDFTRQFQLNDSRRNVDEMKD